MKKLLSIILTVIVSVNLVLAGGGGGGSIFPITTGMTGSNPAKYPCADPGWKTAMLTGQTGVPLTTGASACPTGGCTNPGYFAPYYETFAFKNTLLTPQCIKVVWTAAAAAGCNITFTYMGTGPVLLWTPTGAPCYTDNMGSPGPVCMGTNVSYGVEVPACSDFTVFLGNNNGARNTFNLDIQNATGGQASIGCVGAECLKVLTLGGTPVPTMTQWGLFLFGLILITLGVVTVYNMSRRNANETSVR